MIKNISHKNSISPNRLKNGKKIRNITDISSNKFNIDKNIIIADYKKEKLKKLKDNSLIKRKISEINEKSEKIVMELNKNKKEIKKDYSSFNIINESKNTIYTTSLTLNSTNDNNMNFDKIFFDNNNKLFSTIKIFNNKINEIIHWLISKDSNINKENIFNKQKNVFYYQLTLLKKKVNILQENLIFFFEKLNEDLDYSQKDESRNILGPNLNKFYNDIRFINDYLIPKIKNRKDATTRNIIDNLDNCSGAKSVSQKNFLNKNDKLPFLRNKKFEYSLSTQNINLFYGNNIIDETDEEINENKVNNVADKNRINKDIKNKNIKKKILLKEKENENKEKNQPQEKKEQTKNRNSKMNFEKKNKTAFSNFKLNKINNEIKNDNFNKDDKYIKLNSERKEYISDDNENIEEENNANDFEKEEEKKVLRVRIGKISIADFFRNIYRKKRRKSLGNKADFII